MTDPIEDTIEPETVNELLLLNRIRDLKLVIYQTAGAFPPIMWEPEPLDLSPTLPDTVTLHLAASLSASPGHSRRGMRVDGHAKSGTDKTVVGYYIPDEVLRVYPKPTALNELGRLHKRFIHDLARSL